MADDLLVAAFDRSPAGPATPPPNAYAVCATPRSGSTLLSEGLRALGSLGTPAEYFNIEATVRPLQRRWGSATIRDYVCDLYRFRTSPTGVFGLKLHWQQVEEMRDRLGLGPPPGADGTAERGMLEALFPGLRYVRVRRSDLERQAVSYWIAEHTQQWSVHSGEEPPPAGLPAYDFAGIDALARKIEHGETSWDRYFSDNGIEPMWVTYEELSDSYRATVARVATALGTPLGAGEVPEPRLRRQADPESERLIERYRAERSRGREV